ncbi:nucleolar, Nop52, partial [Kipferlia bialata]
AEVADILAAQMAGLSRDQAGLYLYAGMHTCCLEWTSVDYCRVDKVYYLLRVLLRKGLEYDSSLGQDELSEAIVPNALEQILVPGREVCK